VGKTSANRENKDLDKNEVFRGVSGNPKFPEREKPHEGQPPTRRAIRRERSNSGPSIREIHRNDKEPWKGISRRTQHRRQEIEPLLGRETLNERSSKEGVAWHDTLRKIEKAQENILEEGRRKRVKRERRRAYTREGPSKSS